MNSKRPRTTSKKKLNPPSVRKTSGGGDRTSQAPALRERVAKRAYEIYERRIHLGSWDDWLQAEREILGQKRTRNPDTPNRGGYTAQEQE